MRRQLVIAIAGVAIVAVLVLAIPLGVALSDGYRNEALLRLQRDAVADTRAVDLGAGPADPVELPRTSDLLAAYRRDGMRAGGRGPARAPEVVRRALASGRPEQTTLGDQLLVAVPLLSGERVTGAALARRSDRAADRDARTAWLVLGAVATAIILAAVAAARVLGSRLATPVEGLADSARRLGQGDFSVQAGRSRVPELDALSATINATAARLEELIGNERAFSADASHQLRTPLQALRLELEAAQLRGVEAPELAAALAQADRLEATVATLLEIRRDRPPARSAMSIDALLESVDREWHATLAARGRPLRSGLGARGLHARASEPVAREILNALIANADHHGGGAITIAGRSLDGFTAIDVSDEGAGFVLDEAAAFARGVGRGHGIGLALARSLAHAEGGRLTLTRPGPGPVVTLLLPGA